METNQAEARYIKKRKQRAALVRAAYCLMHLFPIRARKIVFTAFEGDGGYCCNPRYIAEALLRESRQYRLVWLVNDTNRRFPKGIQKAKNTFWRRAYHLATAKVWVDNSRKEYGTQKRKGQVYIQTWHGAIAFKPLGEYRGKSFPEIARLVSKYDSSLIDYVLSNSKWCTEHYPKMLLYDGKIIKTGSPRCDLFFTKRKELYDVVRKRYGLGRKAKIILFAPTFRGGGQKGKRQVFAGIPTLDFGRMKEALERRFQGTWTVFLRLHPQLSAKMKEMPLEGKYGHMVDVSQADDMNEILAAADVLVTDYSSVAFDALCMYMPVFLYMDDLKEYTNERGRLMWDLGELPFPVAESNEELFENICRFDLGMYEDAVRVFLARQEVLEDGRASERVVGLINRISGYCI